MKKIYVSLIALLFISFSFSQTNSKFNTAKRGKSMIQLTSNNHISTPIVYDKVELWSNDFSNPSDWVMVNNSNPSLDWIITSADLPSNWGTGPLLSTSGANGYALFDSDGAGDGTTQDAIMTIANPIDLSANNGVVLSFEQYHARYLEQTLVLVSGDNGSTWTTFEMNLELAVNGNTTNPNFKEINISAVAGGQSQVLIAFQYIGAWDYGWAVDDVKISTSFDNDVALGKSFTHDIYNGYDYSIVATNQIQALTVGAIISNLGSNPIVNGSVNVTINDGISDVYNQNIPYDLAVGVSDTLWVPTGYTPTPNSNFAVNFTATDDDNNTNNNALQSNFATNDFNYAHDFTIDGVYRFDIDDETSMGNLFQIYNSANLFGASIKFEMGTTAANARLKVSRFNYDDANYNSVQAMEEITDFAFEIPIADIGSGNFSTILFDSPISMESGWYYVLEIRKDFGTDRIFIGGSAEGDDDFSTVCYGPFGAGSAVNYFTGWGFAPAVRMFFDLSAPTIVSSNPTNTFCQGESLTLTSSENNGNQWNLNGNPIIGETNETLIVTAAGTYSVIVNGESSDEIVVNVNALPIVNAGNDVTICAGSSITFNATGANSYVWSNGVLNGGIFTPSSTNTYTVIGTIDNCSASDDLTITVSSALVIQQGAVNSPSSCGLADGNIVVNGSLTGDLSWSGTVNGTLNSVTLPQTISGLQAGSYSIIFTDASGCSSNLLAVSISDVGIIVPTISANGPTTFCEGASVSLESSEIIGITWTNGSTDQIISVNTSGIYHVSYTDGFCTSNSEAIQVIVNPTPTLATLTTLNPTTCSGQDGIIVVSNSDNGTIAWNGPSSGSLNASSSPSTIAGLAAGNYTITLTSQSCISSDLSVQLMNPNVETPTITAVGSTVFCEGESVTLNSSFADSYLWSNGLTTPSIDVVLGGDYTVTTTVNDCSATSNVTVVVVNSLPIIDGGANQTVCQGTSVTLSGSGALSYVWSNNVINNLPFNASSTTTYIVTGIDANDCQNTDEVLVTVNVPLINAGSDKEVCLGESVNLTASGSNDLTWSTLETSNTITVAPTAITTYTVSGTDANSCFGTDEVVVVVNQLPTINAGGDQTVCIGTTIILIGTGGVDYTWNNGITNNTAFVVPNDTTTYTVTGTDANGCVNTDDVTINVNDCLGINEENLSSLKIYPNPTSSLLTISADDFNDYSSLSVQDQLGRVVVSPLEITSTTLTVDLTHLSDGTYLVVLSGTSDKKVIQVQVNR
jgi:hypothetical protein